MQDGGRSVEAPAGRLQYVSKKYWLTRDPLPLSNSWSTVTRFSHRSSTSVSFTHRLTLSHAGTRLLELLLTGWWRDLVDLSDRLWIRVAFSVVSLNPLLASNLSDMGGSDGQLVLITTRSSEVNGIASELASLSCCCNSFRAAAGGGGIQSPSEADFLCLVDGSPLTIWASTKQLVRMVDAVVICNYKTRLQSIRSL